MKLYICAIIDTEGVVESRESELIIDTNKNQLIERAYSFYMAEKEYMKEEETFDDEKMFDSLPDTLEEFKTDFLSPDGCVLLQRYDSHMQLEYYEREV